MKSKPREQLYRPLDLDLGLDLDEPLTRREGQARLHRHRVRVFGGNEEGAPVRRSISLSPCYPRCPRRSLEFETFDNGPIFAPSARVDLHHHRLSGGWVEHLES